MPCVSRRAEAREEHLHLVGLAVAVGVGVLADLADARDDARLLQSGSGRMPMGMFRSSAKVCTLPRLAGRGSKSERTNSLSVALPGRRGERVVVRGGDPQPALGVEGHLHRLLDVGLAGDELHLEAGRER